jgi:MFS family permease
LKTQTPESPANLTWHHRLPFFYGWVVVAVGFGMMFASNGINWSLGVISSPMRDDLGWTLSDIFTGLMIRVLATAVGAALFTRFADYKNGPMRSVAVTGMIIAFSLALTSRVQEVWQFWLLFGVVNGLASGGHSALVTAAVVPRWFRRSRGRAVATATMGSSVAAFILPTSIAFLIRSSDWDTAWLVLAGLFFVLSVFPALLIRRQPEDLGMVPDGGDAPRNSSAPPPAPEVSMTAREARRSKIFWLLIITVSLATTSSMGVPAIMAPMFEWKEFTPERAALAATIYGLFSLSSRYLWGYLADKIPVNMLLAGVGVFNAMTLPLLIILSGDVAYVYAALVGIGVSGLVVAQGLVWPYYFGRAHLGAIIGMSRPIPVIMSASAILLMSQDFDRSGSYTFSLAVMGIMAGLSAVMMITASKVAWRKAEA